MRTTSRSGVPRRADERTVPGASSESPSLAIPFLSPPPHPPLQPPCRQRQRRQASRTRARASRAAQAQARAALRTLPPAARTPHSACSSRLQMFLPSPRAYSMIVHSSDALSAHVRRTCGGRRESTGHWQLERNGRASARKVDCTESTAEISLSVGLLTRSALRLRKKRIGFSYIDALL